MNSKPFEKSALQISDSPKPTPEQINEVLGAVQITLERIKSLEAAIEFQGEEIRSQREEAAHWRQEAIGFKDLLENKEKESEKESEAEKTVKDERIAGLEREAIESGYKAGFAQGHNEAFDEFREQIERNEEQLAELTEENAHLKAFKEQVEIREGQSAKAESNVLLIGFAEKLQKELQTVLESMRLPVSEIEQEKRKIVHQKVFHICEELREKWKDAPENFKNKLEAILVRSNRMVGKEELKKPILEDFSEEKILSILSENFRRDIESAVKPISLEGFSKGDIPVLVEFFDDVKINMPKELADNIEKEMQELFSVVDLEEIKIVPYETPYNAYLHDLIRLEKADPSRKIYPKSTIIRLEARGFRYKAQVHIKSMVIVAE